MDQNTYNRNVITVTIVLIVLILLAGSIHVHATLEPIELTFYETYFNTDGDTEFAKHFKETYNTTTSISITNGMLIVTTTSGYDSPVFELKNYVYNSDSLAKMPYNYTLSLAFKIADKNNILTIILRSGGVTVDSSNHISITNAYLVKFSPSGLGSPTTVEVDKVVDGTLTKITTGSATLSSDDWIIVSINIKWDGSQNSLEISYYDNSTSTSPPPPIFVSDDSLKPQYYNYIGFIVDSNGGIETEVDLDYIKLTAYFRHLGSEPGEESVATWGNSDLDITKVFAYNDTSSTVILFYTASDIESPTGYDDTKDWNVYLDTDKADRGTLGGFGADDVLNIEMGYGGDTSLTLTGVTAQIIGGGIGYEYWVVNIDNTLPASFYVKLDTQYEGTTKAVTYDTVPQDDTGGEQTGDYYIYYQKMPQPTTVGDALTDDLDDENVPDTSLKYLDLYVTQGGYDGSNLYFYIEVNNDLSYPATNSTGYQNFFVVYIDSDNDPDTGRDTGDILGTPIIGADYKIEFTPGWIPRLYYWDEEISMDWVFLSMVDYMYNPVGSYKLNITIPESYFTRQNLVRDPPYAVATFVGPESSSNVADKFDKTTIVPVPEWSVVIALVFLAAISFVLYRKTGV